MPRRFSFPLVLISTWGMLPRVASFGLFWELNTAARGLKARDAAPVLVFRRLPCRGVSGTGVCVVSLW